VRVKSCMPVIPSADVEKSLRFWIDGLGLTMDRPMRQDGRLVGCMVHNEHLYFWLNQRAGSPIKPENYEGIRLYWAPHDIHALRDRLERLGYAVSEITDRDYGQTEFFVTDDDGYSHCFGVATNKGRRPPQKTSPMFDWFSTLAAGSELLRDAASELQERGFIVLPGPVPSERMEQLADAYTAAVAAATGNDIRIGSTSTKVSDFVNRGAEFDDLYTFPPLLEACCRVIGRPFKLSSLLGRTLRPRSSAQELHVDVRRDSADWPLLGFILMIDEFRPDNGATRFVPGSHRWSVTPEDAISDLRAKHEKQVLACGSAGSLVVFNGSAWHGHTENRSSGPRRSLQGAFVPRDGCAATDFAARMQPETRARLGQLARYVLAL
jgi:lactoylglutathione lyase